MEGMYGKKTPPSLPAPNEAGMDFCWTRQNVIKKNERGKNRK